LIIVEHCIAGSGVTAILGSRPRNDDGLDSPFPKDEVKISGEEAAVAVLLDDVFAGRRRQVAKNLNSLRSVDQASPIRNGPSPALNGMDRGSLV
jgi:hypothetical protein